MESGENMHDNTGHRQRVKDRFIKEGLDNFEEVHVLELLLHYAISRKDTKELAREVLNRFGSLCRVMDATEQELCSIKGIGPSSAAFFRLITEASRYYLTAKAKNPQILDTPEKYGSYLVNHFLGRLKETVFLLCLDAKYKCIGCYLVGEGDVNSANVPVRRMVELALNANATLVVLAHNHPSGVAIPSVEDLETTRQLATALGPMDIALLDHVVVADEDFTSMLASRWFDPRQYSRLL
jgi:DNA repair protein RadC